MSRYSFIVAAASIVCCFALPAAAQRRPDITGPVPDEGMIGAGAQITAAMPFENSWKNGIDLTGSLERYLSRRVSVRGAVSGAWLDIQGRGFDGTINPIAFNGNLSYNWEGGKWHPYLTGGAGFYHYRFSEGIDTSHANKFGVDFGGGTEYFFTRHDSLLGEVLVHAIPGTVTSRATTYEDPSYWTLSAGYKKYFGR